MSRSKDYNQVQLFSSGPLVAQRNYTNKTQLIHKIEQWVIMYRLKANPHVILINHRCIEIKTNCFEYKNLYLFA